MDAWSGLNRNRVPSCVQEVFDGTAHDVHSKPKAFWPLGLQNGEKSSNSQFTDSIRHGTWSPTNLRSQVTAQVGQAARMEASMAFVTASQVE